jgi:hypothetical protein
LVMNQRISGAPDELSTLLWIHVCESDSKVRHTHTIASSFNVGASGFPSGSEHGALTQAPDHAGTNFFINRIRL